MRKRQGSTSADDATDSTDKPSYEHDTQHLHSFIRDLEPYLKKKNANYKMLWEMGVCIPSESDISAAFPHHADAEA